MRTCGWLGTFPLRAMFFLRFVTLGYTEIRAILLILQTIAPHVLVSFPYPLTQTLFLSPHIHPALALALDHSQFALCKTKANKPVGGERGEEHGDAPTSNIMTGRPSK